MPSQALVQQFNNYPDELLEKLLTIADTVLKPNVGELSAVDFASMIELVFSSGGLADTHFPDWTDRSESDFGRFMVELMCLFSDKDFFYINHFSREGFGTRAEIYKNLVHKAKSNGFHPPSNVSASASFTLTFNSGALEVIPRGAIQIGLDGVANTTFTNDEFTVPFSVGSLNVSVPMYHGVIKDADGSFDGRSIIIDDTGIADSSIELIVAGTPYTETTSFANGTPATNHYMVFYNELGQAEIVFPNELFGVVPSVGDSYTLTYRKGGGYVGVLSAATLDTIQKDNSTRGVTAFVQPETNGGTNLLDIETLRQRYLSFQRTLNRAVSVQDVETIAKELDFVYNAKCVNVTNYFFLYVVPEGGGNPSAAQLSDVNDYFITPQMKLISGFALLVGAPIYIDFVLDIDIYVLPETEAAGALQIASEVVAWYTDSGQGGKAGEGIVRGRLSNYILSRVEGAQNVDFNLCHKLSDPPAAADIVVDSYEWMGYQTSIANININIIGGQ